MSAIKVYQPPANPPASRWNPAPSWVAAALVVVATLAILLWAATVLIGDVRQAARECRESAAELRQAQDDLRRERELNEAARRDFLAKAMSFVLSVEEKKHGD